jgi:hypothetical protein
MKKKETKRTLKEADWKYIVSEHGGHHEWLFFSKMIGEQCYVLIWKLHTNRIWLIESEYKVTDASTFVNYFRYKRTCILEKKEVTLDNIVETIEDATKKENKDSNLG